MSTREATTVIRTDTTFLSAGVACAAWHYSATSDALATDRGRPCVVMAHGFGGTRDSGLEGFAEAFATAGADVVVFDYRTFGASAGEPRQLVDIKGQLDDYGAALRFARGLDGVDGDRVVVWGVSLSGGHVFRLAAADRRLVAAISLTPLTDGRAAARAVIRQHGLVAATRGTPAAARDAIGARRGQRPVYVPLVGGPGEVAALAAPGAYEAYTALGGPTWENRIAARALLGLGSYRPGKAASEIGCPVLVQIADLDQSAPPLAAADSAKKLRAAEVRHYPCDHFDVYPGTEWGDTVTAHQVAFLARHLTPASVARG